MTCSLTPKQEELQALLAGPAKNILLYGGSRSGKTFLLCYAIATRAIMAPGSRHAIFRKHGVAVKQSIGLDTLPKVLELAYPDLRWHYDKQDGYYTLQTHGGTSEIWLAGLDDKERVDKVLGREYSTLYFNEASEIPYQSFVVAQTRLAQQVDRFDGAKLRLKTYVDLNPTVKQHWTYKLWIEGANPETDKPVTRADYAFGIANPRDNAENLSEDYIRSLEELPDRQRRRFFEGQYTGDVEDALWRRETIRHTWQDSWQDIDMRRVVVAIDPAASTAVGSDETGIVCAGVDRDGRGYVLADVSGRYQPEEWARRALALYEEFEADCIVAEANNGGDMVEATIRSQQRKSVRTKQVRAARGKVIRAEPVAALYERGKIIHFGEHVALEDQMCNFTVGFDRKEQGYSPDRVDAMVWAFSELFGLMTTKRSEAKLAYPKLANVA